MESFVWHQHSSGYLLTRDNDSFSRRFQFVGYSSPFDPTREGSGHSVVKIKQRGDGPEKKMSWQTPSQLVAIPCQWNTDGAQAQVRLGRTQQEDRAKQREQEPNREAEGRAHDN